MKTLEDCYTIKEVAELVEAQNTESDKAKIAGGYAFDAANDQRDDNGGFVTKAAIEAQLEFLTDAGCTFNGEYAIGYAGLHDADWHAEGAVEEMSDENQKDFMLDSDAWKDGLGMWPMWSHDLAFTLDDFINAIEENIENKNENKKKIEENFNLRANANAENVYSNDD